MRVPLSQVADMATYIAKNKLRPKPEWQKNVAPDRGPRQSVQDRPHADSFGEERAQAASHDQQALPAGDDAGAAARLQPDLHRLRTHPRIRRQHSRPRVAGELPEGGGRVRRAHGLDLRRRAAAAARYRRDVRGDPEARPLHSAVHQRHVPAQAPEGFHAASQPGVQRSPGRHGEESRHRRRARGRFQGSHRRRSGRQGRRLQGVLQHHGLQRDRHERDLGVVRVSWSSSASTGTPFRRATATPR